MLRQWPLPGEHGPLQWATIGGGGAEMLQDGFDDILLFDETDDPHSAIAFWTNQGIDLVDLADQPGPAFPENGGALSDSIRQGVTSPTAFLRLFPRKTLLYQP